MAKRVFQHYFARVSRAIQGSTDDLAREMYSSKLMDNVLTTPGLPSVRKSSYLMSAVKNKIDVASNKKPFKDFCGVSKSCRELESLATKMTTRFGK